MSHDIHTYKQRLASPPPPLVISSHISISPHCEEENPFLSRLYLLQYLLLSSSPPFRRKEPEEQGSSHSPAPQIKSCSSVITLSPVQLFHRQRYNKTAHLFDSRSATAPLASTVQRGGCYFCTLHPARIPQDCRPTKSPESKRTKTGATAICTLCVCTVQHFLYDFPFASRVCSVPPALQIVRILACQSWLLRLGSLLLSLAPPRLLPAFRT